MFILKFIVKLLAKILVLPFIILIGVLRLAVNIVIHVYGFAAIWFWIFIAICIVWTIVNKLWSQTFILVSVGLITFIILFISVAIEMTLEDIGNKLKGILFN